MPAEQSTEVQSLNRELDVVRAARAVVLETAVRRLMEDVANSLTRESELLRQREQLLARPLEPVMIDGRDRRGTPSVVCDILAKAGSEGMFHDDLQKAAEEFGFNRSNVDRAKQRLQKSGAIEYDFRSKRWRIASNQEVAVH